MSIVTVVSGRPLRGSAGVPGDKSISHRALLLGGLARGISHIQGALLEGDCRATWNCLQLMGVSIERLESSAPLPSYFAGHGRQTVLTIHGRGLRELSEPPKPLDCQRSGTTMRLLSGVLAGQSFASVLTGHEQLLRRPMRRVVIPLRMMGARIEDEDGHAPLHIRGSSLHGIDYALPVASAQVKSAILLAGLLAEGPTTVREPATSRDHTERMLCAMGADLSIYGRTITISPSRALAPIDLTVPGDMSSAAFLLAAGTIVPGSELIVRDVGLNPTRTGFLDALQSMGADVTVLDWREAGGEPVGDVRARAGAPLHGIEIGGDWIPRLIDELPILAVVATQARGITTIRDAAELRVKETDRIAGMVSALRRLGAHVEERADGMLIEGPCRLRGALVSGQDDHRIAMSLIIAGLLAEGETSVEGAEFISDSYPGFVDTLRFLGAEIRA